VGAGEFEGGAEAATLGKHLPDLRHVRHVGAFAGEERRVGQIAMVLDDTAAEIPDNIGDSGIKVRLEAILDLVPGAPGPIRLVGRPAVEFADSG